MLEEKDSLYGEVKLQSEGPQGKKGKANMSQAAREGGLKREAEGTHTAGELPLSPGMPAFVQPLLSTKRPVRPKGMKVPTG